MKVRMLEVHNYKEHPLVFVYQNLDETPYQKTYEHFSYLQV